MPECPRCRGTYLEGELHRCAEHRQFTLDVLRLVVVASIGLTLVWILVVALR